MHTGRQAVLMKPQLNHLSVHLQRRVMSHVVTGTFRKAMRRLRYMQIRKDQHMLQNNYQMVGGQVSVVRMLI